MSIISPKEGWGTHYTKALPLTSPNTTVRLPATHKAYNRLQRAEARGRETKKKTGDQQKAHKPGKPKNKVMRQEETNKNSHNNKA